MLNYHKTKLLAQLSRFKTDFLHITEKETQHNAMLEHDTEYINIGSTILNNLTSIEKQVNKL